MDSFLKFRSPRRSQVLQVGDVYENLDNIEDIERVANRVLVLCRTQKVMEKEMG